jgi:2-polyprenyl-3-methyl-5-hydroxy-6-metoxy-1,4-benzoquinol methylase
VPTTTYVIEDQERMAKAANYLAWQSRLILQALGQRVVEIGCGLGNVTGKLLDREMVIGVDINPDCIERIKERYPKQKNLQAMVCDTSSSAFADLARFRPDSCLCTNVLEHIEDDRRALRDMASLLEPGGVIVLFVPAFQGLYGTLDWNLGHYRRYRRGSIARLAEACGLVVKKTHYVNALGFFGWWACSRLLRQEALSERQIVFFDRFVVPWLSRLEALAPPPFGQSLLAVLEKT